MTLDQFNEIATFYGLTIYVHESGNIDYERSNVRGYIKYYHTERDLDLVSYSQSRVSHKISELSTQDVTSLIEQLIGAST